MPAIADLVIKKADGTTNITFSAVQPAGGDKSPAVFRSLSTTGTNGQHPELRVSSNSTKSNSGRQVQLAFSYPSVYTDTTTGLTSVKSRANAQISVFVPADVPDSDLNEFGAQLGNLLASTLIKSVNATGFAPT